MINIQDMKYQNSKDLNLTENSNIYFIGIGGVGLCSIAVLLKNRGHNIKGSDLFPNVTTDSLEKIGVKVDFSQDGQNIDSTIDIVVFSSAIQDDNPDLVKARELGIATLKYSQLLGLLMQTKKGVAVSGTHGKTTTSSMISVVLKQAGLRPECVIGGDVPDIRRDDSVNEAGDILVAEACEYDRSFLSLFPKIGIITNIDEDHLDYYKSIKSLKSAFAEFAATLPADGLLVVNGQDSNIEKALSGSLSCRIEKFAIGDIKTLSKNNTWVATKPRFEKGQNKFELYRNGKFFGKFSLVLPGNHNVMNALASIAVCHHFGVDIKVMSTALSSFRGVDRRFQVLENVKDITVVDDYAHHPTAIEATLKVARETFPGKRIWCLFQPHQFSRTKLLLDRFVNAFGCADKIILTEIYQARDSAEDIKSVSSADVVSEMWKIGLDVEFMPDHREIVEMLCDDLSSGDVLITMGAGDVWKVAKEVIVGLNQSYETSSMNISDERGHKSGLAKFSINSASDISAFFFNQSKALALHQL